MGLLVLSGIWAGCESPAPETPASATAVSPPPATAQETKPLEEKAPAPAVKAGEITSVDIEHLFLLKGEDKALVVDVRPNMFYLMGHIEGAISLPLKTYDASYPKKRGALEAALKAGKVLVLYCADVNCPDGYAVAKSLSAAGYPTSLYKGGWEVWKAAGLE
jgi:rhodanese-related sulfurtransferase